MKKRMLALALSLAAAFGASAALAATPKEILDGYSAAAKQADPAFKGFSAERGKVFYSAKHGKEWACASCHTDNPAGPGKHASTGRDIKPMAPSANAERFTDAEKVERLFKRQCDSVLGRDCTATEKGDFMSYLIGAK